MPTELVLSSGFLAFARQTGFLAAIEQRGIEVGGVCGTSSGALAGSLFSAGVPAEDIGALLNEAPPLRQIALSGTPWRGLFAMGPVIDRLAEFLPERIEDLERPFGVGVMGPGRRPSLLTSGPLRQAVAASCAIPYLFTPVVLDGVPYQDGGVVDRTALEAWRAHRPDRAVILHLVDSSRGGEDAPVPEGVTVVRTPKSGAKLWNLGDFEAQVEEAKQRTLEALSAFPADASR
ncbi:MAG: patatin-like phospholipase family protein [Proteobacteria bacterium]|nr:patatin-like phospholipase family protein [Pseudomonadota bacterium]